MLGRMSELVKINQDNTNLLQIKNSENLKFEKSSKIHERVTV